MKKRFIAIVTMLLALVMSFALLACGEEPDNQTPPPDKSVVVGKALTSLGEYMGANVRKGKFEYAVDTAETDKKSGAVEFTQNGTDVYYRLATDANGVEHMLDARTGLRYTITNNKWSFAGTAYSQGFVEYGMDVIAGLANSGSDEDKTRAAANNDGFSLDDIEYDVKTNSLIAQVDVAEKINRPLGPLQEVYDAEGSLKSLIDAYLKEYYSEITAKLPIIKAIGKPITVKKICDYLKLELVRVKSTSLVEYVESLTKTDIGADYEEYLENRGLTGERLEAAKARTVGEAIEGALAYINAKIDISKITNGDYSGVTDIINTIESGTDEDRQALLDELVDYVAINDVDMTNYEKDVVDLINKVDDLLKGIKIKPLIDGITNIKIPGMSDDAAKALGLATPVVKAIITEQVTLEKLGATVYVKLHSDYTVDSINVELFASHDYEGDSELPLLSDNDYSASFTLTLTGCSNELESSYEPDFAPYDKDTNGNLHDYAESVIRLDGDDVMVYIETRMFDEVEVKDIAVAYVDGNGERHVFDAEDVVVFGGSSFVFDVDGIQAAALATISSGDGVDYVDMQATVSYGEAEADSYTVNIKLYVVPDASTDSALDLVSRIAEHIIPNS